MDAAGDANGGLGQTRPVARVAHYPQSGRQAPAEAWRRRSFPGLLLIACCLVACASHGPREGSAPARHAAHGLSEPGRRAANDVLIRALGLVGTPYRHGGDSPEGGFDCSGLVAYVFREAAGLRLPRSTREQVLYPAPKVGRDQLAPGDLVFFRPGGADISHIGIFVGDGRFVHAPSRGGTVRLDSLDAPYWRQAFASARRILP